VKREVVCRIHLSNSTNHDSPNSPPPTQLCLFPARRRHDPTRVRSMTTTMRECDGTPDATDVWRRYRTDGALASECLRTTSERDEATRLREQVRRSVTNHSNARRVDDARARDGARSRARTRPWVVSRSLARRLRRYAIGGTRERGMRTRETREGFGLNVDAERRVSGEG